MSNDKPESQNVVRIAFKITTQYDPNDPTKRVVIQQGYTTRPLRKPKGN